MHKYEQGDMVHIQPAYSPSEYAGKFGEVLEVRDDLCQVRFYLEDNTYDEVVQLADIDSYIVNIVASYLVHALYVWDMDQRFDVRKFRQGQYAIAVLKDEVDAFLGVCDICNIQWADGVAASKFNPYVEFCKMGSMGSLYCALSNLEPPSKYCIFAMNKQGLEFMFSEVISDCIADSMDR